MHEKNITSVLGLTAATSLFIIGFENLVTKIKIIRKFYPLRSHAMIL